RVGPHVPLAGDLPVVGGDRVAVVETLVLTEIESPALAVGGQLPALGSARADSTVLQVESDQRVPDRRVVVRVRRAGVHDRVHDPGGRGSLGEEAWVLVGGDVLLWGATMGECKAMETAVLRRFDWYAWLQGECS